MREGLGREGEERGGGHEVHSEKEYVGKRERAWSSEKERKRTWGRERESRRRCRYTYISNCN